VGVGRLGSPAAKFCFARRRCPAGAKLLSGMAAERVLSARPALMAKDRPRLSSGLAPITRGGPVALHRLAAAILGEGKLVFDINSLIPIVTIIGAASAPTIAAIWAENRRKRDAREAARERAEVKETLVATSDVANTKLDEAVNRLTVATAEIEELKRMVSELQKPTPAKRSLLPF
jgi:hypothetical protein